MNILTCNMVGWQKCVGFFGQKAKSVTSQWLVELHRPLLFYSFIFPLSTCASPQLFLTLLLLLTSLKGVRPDVDGESEGGAGLVAALVAEQRVNWHHLQVQRVLSGSRDSAGQHQHGTDIIDLLEKKKQILLNTFLQQRYRRQVFSQQEIVW